MYTYISPRRHVSNSLTELYLTFFSTKNLNNNSYLISLNQKIFTNFDTMLQKFAPQNTIALYNSIIAYKNKVIIKSNIFSACASGYIEQRN